MASQEITLANLASKSAQEVFNYVVNHLLTQKEKAGVAKVGDGFECRYLATDGKRCAAGCLIAAEEYSGRFETYRWGSLVGDGEVPDHHADLISSLQIVHDNYTPSRWPERLDYTADKYGLEIPASLQA